MSENTSMVAALRARKECQANIYMTQEEATEQYLGMQWECVMVGNDVSEAEEKTLRQQAVTKAKALLQQGEALFAQGYRLHCTSRQIRGLGFDVPDDAEEWDVYPAGHIATTEAERLYWVTKQ